MSLLFSLLTSALSFFGHSGPMDAHGGIFMMTPDDAHGGIICKKKL